MANVVKPFQHLIAPLLFGLVFLAAAASAQGVESGGGDPLSRDLMPAPVLSPEDVVRIQIEALRRNDERNRGIEVAFGCRPGP